VGTQSSNFKFTGETDDRIRPTLQIGNNDHFIEITQITSLAFTGELPYKGGGSIAFGVYDENGARTGVVLGRIYGAGVRQSDRTPYVVIHPEVEGGETKLVTEYAERKSLGFSKVTTLEELKASLE